MGLQARRYGVRRRAGAAMAALLALSLAGGAAFAQGANGLGDHDASQAINVAADALEVRQEENLAIFEGNVDVAQGDMRLRADRLEVHYDPKAESSDAGAITKLDARGNVFVSSPKETARGDWGVYDVTTRKIRMGGKVVLTQGESVIRGDKLTIDLASGRSRIEGGGSGRVKGLFVPGSSGPGASSSGRPDRTEPKPKPAE